MCFGVAGGALKAETEAGCAALAALRLALQPANCRQPGIVVVFVGDQLHAHLPGIALQFRQTEVILRARVDIGIAEENHGADPAVPETLQNGPGTRCTARVQQNVPGSARSFDFQHYSISLISIRLFRMAYTVRPGTVLMPVLRVMFFRCVITVLMEM